MPLTGTPQPELFDGDRTLPVTSMALGVPPHIVREIAGHSDIKVTMTVYAHGNLDEHAAALKQLSGMLLSTTDVNPDYEEVQDRAHPA